MRILLLILAGYFIINYIKEVKIVETFDKVVIYNEIKEDDPEKKALDIFENKFGIRFPEVFLGQVYTETDKLRSNIYRECKNVCGMKYNDRGYAIGECRGHAKYDSYIDSVKDYAEWQKTYLTWYEKYRIKRKCITKLDYYDFLDNQGYAEDPDYLKTVDQYVVLIEKWNH